MRRSARTSGASGARGFVLPVVVLLILVVGLALGVAMARQGVQSNIVARQVTSYQEHHAGRGLQEAIGAWLRTLSTREIADSIGENGHAMDILLPGGDVASVYVADGQGTALASLNGLGGESLENAARVLDSLLSFADTDTYRRSIRRFGPWQISPDSASPAVLRAVIGSREADEAAVASAVSRLIEARASARIDRGTVIGVFDEAGVSEEAEANILRVFTFQPELWMITVELKPLGTTRIVARYGGVAYIGSAAEFGGAGRAGTFLSWENLGLDDRAARETIERAVGGVGGG